MKRISLIVCAVLGIAGCGKSVSTDVLVVDDDDAVTQRGRFCFANRPPCVFPIYVSSRNGSSPNSFFRFSNSSTRL